MNLAVTFSAFALTAASFLLGGTMESGSVGIGLVILCMGGAIFGGRLAWGTVSQAGAAFLILILGSVLAMLMDTGQLHPFFAAIGLIAIGIGAFRLVLVTPFGGHGTTIAAGLAAVLACGTERTDQPYVQLMTIFLVLGLLALRWGDRGRVEWRRLGPRRWWLGTGGLLASVGLAVGLSAALPRIHERLAWAPRYRQGSRAGFSGDNLRLGSLRGLLQSQRVVLRIHGPAPSHLRGEVYRRFVDDKWKRDREKTRTRLLSPDAIEMAELRGEAVTHVWVVSDDVRHVFLPLGWSDLYADPPEIAITGTSTVRTARGDPLEEYSFWVGDTPKREPSQGGHNDDDVPPEILQELRAIALDWTRNLIVPRDQLDAIQRRLRKEFTYSTHYVRGQNQSHLLQFFEDKRGHCEYFASALALLGRSLGIKTRLVGGYHVSERNPFGDYAVVRERDAHAWVEAWLPEAGGWVTFDPTPPAEIVQTQAPFLSALIDWIADEFRRRGPLGLIVPLLMVLLFVVVRRFLRLTASRLPRVSGLEYDPPPAYVEELLAHLAGRGFERPSHEPIERLARRLVESDREDEAQLLLRYSEARFGRSERSRETELEVAVRQWIEASAG